MSPLEQVEKVWADKARDLLAPFRDRYERPGSIIVSQFRADRLEQAICEALVEAYEQGKDDLAWATRDTRD